MNHMYDQDSNDINLSSAICDYNFYFYLHRMYLQNDTSTNNDMATILKNDNDNITTTKTITTNKDKGHIYVKT